MDKVLPRNPNNPITEKRTPSTSLQREVVGNVQNMPTIVLWGGWMKGSMLNWHINKLSPLDIQYWDACPQIDSKVSQFQVETTCVGASLQRSLDLFDKADISDSFFSPLEAPVLLVLRLAAAVHTRVQARPRARARKISRYLFLFCVGEFCRDNFSQRSLSNKWGSLLLVYCIVSDKSITGTRKSFCYHELQNYISINNIIW